MSKGKYWVEMYYLVRLDIVTKGLLILYGGIDANPCILLEPPMLIFQSLNCTHVSAWPSTAEDIYPTVYATG